MGWGRTQTATHYMLGFTQLILYKGVLECRISNCGTNLFILSSKLLCGLKEHVQTIVPPFELWASGVLNDDNTNGLNVHFLVQRIAWYTRMKVTKVALSAPSPMVNSVKQREKPGSHPTLECTRVTSIEDPALMKGHAKGIGKQEFGVYSHFSLECK